VLPRIDAEPDRGSIFAIRYARHIAEWGTRRDSVACPSTQIWFDVPPSLAA